MPGYYFNLPTLSDLTADQRAALNEPKQIALSGGPGTGKSVVSLWRHIQKCTNSQNTYLVTYTTTLARYLAACAKIQNEKAANNIGSAIRQRNNIINETYDEIIIDEAQDLGLFPPDSEYLPGINYYDGISCPVSFGADESQILYPEHCSQMNALLERFNNNIEYVLGKNFRSTYCIMKFAKDCFPNAYIPQSLLEDLLKRNTGVKPVLEIVGRHTWNDEKKRYNTSNEKQNSAISSIIATFNADDHNISILVPFKQDVKDFVQILNVLDIHDFSYFYEDRDDFPNGCPPIKNIHITTYKSSKGLEFDTVIMPNFEIIRNIPIMIKNSGEVICDWKDLYVACTRAKSNLYLLSSYNISHLNSVVELVTL